MTPCPICASTSLRPAWTIDRYALSRCNCCRHLFVSSGFDSTQLEHAYDEDYYEGGDESALGYKDYLGNADMRLRGFAQRLQQVERHVAGRGKLLDYGCAVGFFVKVAADAGWDATGYERSAWAAGYGREKLGLNIVVGRGDDSPPFDNQFDVITMWDVLEHLEDPRAVLQSVARWLKPGGLLALNTVNGASYGARRAGADWRHIAPPHHLQYFSRQSLHHALRECGMRVVSTQSQGVMWSADRRQTQLRGLRRGIEEIATHWRAKPIASALDLLDEVDIVAVRER